MQIRIMMARSSRKRHERRRNVVLFPQHEEKTFTVLQISSLKSPSCNVFKLYKLFMCCTPPQTVNSDISLLGEHGGAKWKETVTFSHLQSISLWNFCLFLCVHPPSPRAPDPTRQTQTKDRGRGREGGRGSPTLMLKVGGAVLIKYVFLFILWTVWRIQSKHEHSINFWREGKTLVPQSRSTL